MMPQGVGGSIGDDVAPIDIEAKNARGIKVPSPERARFERSMSDERWDWGNANSDARAT